MPARNTETTVTDTDTMTVFRNQRGMRPNLITWTKFAIVAGTGRSRGGNSSVSSGRVSAVTSIHHRGMSETAAAIERNAMTRTAPALILAARRRAARTASTPPRRPGAGTA